MKNIKQKMRILEGSNAISEVIKNIGVDVVSAYPITPQTHIVEDLAKAKVDGESNFAYLKAESEFAAASIVLGAAAAGSRTYSATSSQGLLLMTEVLFNAAGMRLPLVITCANRAVSAPINIWNDQQDVMTIRDSGWILLFAEDHQEAVDQHIMAYKIAETLKIPVMVNVDGFVLTHSYEPVYIPEAKIIKKYLPNYKPTKGEYLDPQNPMSLGAFATPNDYMEIREELHEDICASLKTINQEFKNYNLIIKEQSENNIFNNGLLEYHGPKNPELILVAMGSVIGTIKEVLKNPSNKKVGVLKIKTYRPFPSEAILSILKKLNVKKIAVLEKAISLGAGGPLAIDFKAGLFGQYKADVKNYIIGLGGRDVTQKMMQAIIKDFSKNKKDIKFIK